MIWARALQIQVFRLNRPVLRIIRPWRPKVVRAQYNRGLREEKCYDMRILGAGGLRKKATPARAKVLRHRSFP